MSKPLGELAEKLEDMLPDGPEKSAGMRKLLEAKDCFVRCAIDLPEPVASTVPPHQQRVIDESWPAENRSTNENAPFVVSVMVRFSDAADFAAR